MHNLLRTLVFDGQVSLTLADTTETVNTAIKLHKLSPASAVALGRAISAMTFMSACLKEETGEISLSFQSDGTCGGMGISGNRQLFLRGYIENTQAKGDEEEILGKNGALTIVRDDGYSRPFVGSCAFLGQGGIDGAFEEYYRISEQLPTYIATNVELNERGECVFAGVAALQPLPFADETTLEKTKNTPLKKLLSTLKIKGLQACADEHFTLDKQVWELREAQYRCHCSRDYLQRVLVTLGKEQVNEIIQGEGAVRVHCHYCNSDYEFTQADADKLFG